jgi:hypothetical protein
MSETTYGPEVKWRYRSRESGFEKVGPLSLHWELNGDPISDDYIAEETEARDLWSKWIGWLRSGEGHFHPDLGEPMVSVYWGVHGGPEDATVEAAPHQVSEFYGQQNFLNFFSHPLNAETGEPLNWLRLPVADKLWRPGQSDKGGFIQEASGFKPHALQPAVDLRIFLAAGLDID